MRFARKSHAQIGGLCSCANCAQIGGSGSVEKMSEDFSFDFLAPRLGKFCEFCSKNFEKFENLIFNA